MKINMEYLETVLDSYIEACDVSQLQEVVEAVKRLLGKVEDKILRKAKHETDGQSNPKSPTLAVKDQE